MQRKIRCQISSQSDLQRRVVDEGERIGGQSNRLAFIAMPVVQERHTGSHAEEIRERIDHLRSKVR